MELPAGNTPVDFAYTVHTDIGHACVGSRVDRHPYPLSSPLHSGQTVEIITAPGARPNAAWLNFVVTTKARSRSASSSRTCVPKSRWCWVAACSTMRWAPRTSKTSGAAHQAGAGRYQA